MTNTSWKLRCWQVWKAPGASRTPWSGASLAAAALLTKLASRQVHLSMATARLCAQHDTTTIGRYVGQ